MVFPDSDDVLIRQKSPGTDYLLGTFSAPDQVILRTRDEAVSQGVARAKRQNVRAWFAKDDSDFVLLGTFREENRETHEGIVMAKSVKRTTEDAVATAADRSSKARPKHRSAQVADGDVAHRAYDLYLARGSDHGHDVDDWLKAERELRKR